MRLAVKNMTWFLDAGHLETTAVIFRFLFQNQIIKIHNANNESAWEEVLKWEALHARECGRPQVGNFLKYF